MINLVAVNVYTTPGVIVKKFTDLIIKIVLIMEFME